MSDTEKPSNEAAWVRRLAAGGLLAGQFRDASAVDQRRLRIGAAEIAAPLVYRRVTRPVERKRGHHRCAVGLWQLAPDCLDRFYDDLDAVLDDLFAHATVAIVNLEGWLTARLRRATVEGYRQRRKARGAPLRPRMSRWLAAELGNDRWLIELAVAMLEWVGTDATAGSSTWPLAAWAERRCSATADYTSDEAVVARDVETVLAAMRPRAAWYQKTVEQPLGHKTAPVWFPSHIEAGVPLEPEPLDLAPRHERDEALLQQLAADAIELMGRRIDRGEDPAEVVPQVLNVVFGELPVELGQPPCGPDSDPEQVTILITDPARLERIIATVKGLLQKDEG